MSNLIKVQVNEDGKQLVSTKELYLGLGLNKAAWSRWYVTNIQKNDFFKENIDWLGVQQDVEGNETMDFAITLDFAKHIAMMARTPKSHEYRNYFIECENKVKEQQKPACIEDVLIQSLRKMKDMKYQIAVVKQESKETKKEIQAMRDVITLNPNSWRTETTQIINKIAQGLGGFEHIRLVREESYKLLNERSGSKLGIRQTNMRRKVLEETGSKSRADKVSKLDVIAVDKKLTEVYVAIVKEMAIKYKVA